MNLEDYGYNQDDRWYVNPQVSLDEQNAFINNLRALQAQDNAQIAQQTRGLGTQVPSQLGGLVGGGGYFRSRYQTPQTNQTIADLRAIAQQQALNIAMQNEIDKLKKQYNAAYRKTSLGLGTGGTSSDYLDKLNTLFTNTKNQGDLQETEFAGQEEVDIPDPEKTHTADKEIGGGDLGTALAGGGVGAAAGGLLFGPLGAGLGALIGAYAAKPRTGTIKGTIGGSSLATSDGGW
jgi:hypothetical protein